MTMRIALFFIIFFASATAFGQTQIGMIKDPKWNLVAAYDNKFKNTINLSDNSMACTTSLFPVPT